ncbi:MAG: hypothetical protein V1743_00455 [Nanoarchaeota archaeon]
MEKVIYTGPQHGVYAYDLFIGFVTHLFPASEQLPAERVGQEGYFQTAFHIQPQDVKLIYTCQPKCRVIVMLRQEQEDAHTLSEIEKKILGARTKALQTIPSRRTAEIDRLLTQDWDA